MEAKLAQWAKERGWSDKERDEVLKVLEMAKHLVSVPVIKYIRECVDYKLKYDVKVDKAACKRIQRALKQVQLPPGNHTGYVQIPFPGEEEELRINVTMTNRTHEILLKNDKYLTLVLNEIDKMTNMVLSYYQTLMKDEELCKDMKTVFGEDAGVLTLNKIDRTMFVYDPCERRLGVLAFYVVKDKDAQGRLRTDANGNPKYKVVEFQEKEEENPAEAQMAADLARVKLEAEAQAKN
jgi:hypothetical protein